METCSGRECWSGSFQYNFFQCSWGQVRLHLCQPIGPSYCSAKLAGQPPQTNVKSQDSFLSGLSFLCMGCIAHQNNTQHLASLLHPVGSWSFLGVMVHRGLPSHLPSKCGLGPPTWLLSLPKAAGQTGTMLQPASWAGAIHTSQQLHRCVCQEQVPLPASGFEGFSLQHYSWEHDQKND